MHMQFCRKCLCSNGRINTNNVISKCFIYNFHIVFVDGELFNWYMSDRTEKNPMDFTTREGVAVDSNLFRKENVDDVDSDMSLAKTHPSTFQGNT